MRVLIKGGDEPRFLSGIERRGALRRLAATLRFGGPYQRLDAFDLAAPTVARNFRPQLRAGVAADATGLTTDEVGIELDELERSVVALFDGQLSLGEIADLVTKGATASEDPLRVGMALVATLASYDLLVTGAQRSAP